METFLQDIRFGLRRLAKSPGFSVIAIVSLALGVGANTAIFSLVNAVLLKPLPVASPEQLVAVGVRGKGDSMRAFSYPNYIDFRDRNEVLSGLFVERITPISLSRAGNNQRIWGYLVSGNYFDVLGVHAIKGRTFVPEEDKTRLSHPVAAEGQPAERGANIPTAMAANVGDGYFETMGVDLLAGREFTEQDGEKSTPVAVVNQTFIRTLFPEIRNEADALGKRVSFDGAQGPFMQIVGVARDGKYFNIGEEPRSFIYTPLLQRYNDSVTLVVRTAADPEVMIAAVRGEVQSLDSKMPVFDVKTMNEHMRLSLFPARVSASILGGFGVLALILTAIGIYGVTSYTVAQRTREIGIRMALGADRAGVARMVVRQGMKLAAIGLAIGVVFALMLTRLMSGLLFGVSPSDPITYAVIPAILGGVALGACLVPARRATNVDPIVALRRD